MQFSNAVTSITREVVVKKLYDTILSGNVGLMRTLGKAKPWKSGGSDQYEVLVKRTKSTTGGLVPVGGTLDTTRQETRSRMVFEIQRIHKPVVVDDIEVTLNEGDAQILDLIATEMESIQQDLSDDLGGYLYTGTGATGNSFDSLNNAADDATNFATYGTLARATFTSLNGYYAASIGGLAISDLSTAYDDIQVGSKRPSLIVTTPAVWTSYEGLLQPTVQAGYATTGFPQVTRTGMIPSRNALGGEIGFDSLYYRGTPVVADEMVPAQRLFMYSEEYFGWKGLDLKGYEKVNSGKEIVDGVQSMPIPRGFNWSGLLRSQTQPAEVGHLYLVGNFISENPRHCAQLRGIT